MKRQTCCSRRMHTVGYNDKSKSVSVLNWLHGCERRVTLVCRQRSRYITVIVVIIRRWSLIDIGVSSLQWTQTRIYIQSLHYTTCCRITLHEQCLLSVLWLVNHVHNNTFELGDFLSLLSSLPLISSFLVPLLFNYCFPCLIFLRNRSLKPAMRESWNVEFIRPIKLNLCVRELRYILILILRGKI